MRRRLVWCLSPWLPRPFSSAPSSRRRRAARRPAQRSCSRVRSACLRRRRGPARRRRQRRRRHSRRHSRRRSRRRPPRRSRRRPRRGYRPAGLPTGAATVTTVSSRRPGSATVRSAGRGRRRRPLDGDAADFGGGGGVPGVANAEVVLLVKPWWVAVGIARRVQVDVALADAVEVDGHGRRRHLHAQPVLVAPRTRPCLLCAPADSRRRRRRQRSPKEIQRHDVGDPSVRDRHPSVPLTNAPHLVVPAALQAIAVEHCAAAVALCEPLEFGATARGIPLCASCVEAGQRARRALRDPVGLRPGRREPVGVAGRQHRAATIGQSEGVDAIAPERLMVGRQGHVGVVVR
mmetsp:Transcript_26352/g.86463  ORF Transcript_26352/g.86463 Transcript_26352/m.86463 type:complete len:347 (-) Transcript_26352:1253-2293(-)